MAIFQILKRNSQANNSVFNECIGENDAGNPTHGTNIDVFQVKEERDVSESGDQEIRNNDTNFLDIKSEPQFCVVDENEVTNEKFIPPNCDVQIKTETEDTEECLNSTYFDNYESQEQITSEFFIKCEAYESEKVQGYGNAACDVVDDMNKNTYAECNIPSEVDASHVTSTVPKVPSYACQFCEQVFLIKPFLTLHLKLKHPNEVEINKRICESKIFHTNLKTQICTQCKKEFASLEYLNKHIKNKHEKVGKFHCSHCSMYLKSKTDLTNHVRTLHSDVLSFKCDQCDLSYKFENSVQHQCELNSGIKVFHCQECNQSFPCIKVMQRHIRTVHKPFYACQICDKKFKYKYNLKVHMIVHSDVRQFKCSVCSKMFKSKEHLAKHIKIHNLKLNFICKFCTKKFNSQSNLSSHIQSHSTVKPFQCSQCGKTFKTKKIFKTHMLVHSTVRPFSCDICFKSFKSKLYLKLHSKVHKNS